MVSRVPRVPRVPRVLRVLRVFRVFRRGSPCSVLARPSLRPGETGQQPRVRLPAAAAWRAAAGLPRAHRRGPDADPLGELIPRQRARFTQASAFPGRGEWGGRAPRHRTPLRTKKYINVY
ncbi:hypothetical protein GCM10017779_03510 [Streptomyces capillispiralis]|nr:hypothetical protein GCM10017779_03510 [Streptomyces capillispiralis]